MLKNFAFGILVATMAVAPGAAFAGQGQSNVQDTRQDSAAINGSTSAQSSTSTNNQQQIQRANRYRSGYYSPYHRKNNQTPQSQGSVQRTSQSGAAIDGSLNAQDSVTRNNQRQSVRGR